MKRPSQGQLRPTMLLENSCSQLLSNRQWNDALAHFFLYGANSLFQVLESQTCLHEAVHQNQTPDWAFCVGNSMVNAEECMECAEERKLETRTQENEIQEFSLCVCVSHGPQREREFFSPLTE